MMLDSESLENLMACERIKEELKTVEAECARILERFDHVDHEPMAGWHASGRHSAIGIAVRPYGKRVCSAGCLTTWGDGREERCDG
jgi:hypothetical protein